MRQGIYYRGEKQRRLHVFFQDDQFLNGIEYLIGMVVEGHATPSSWPNGWDCLVEGDTPTDVEWPDPSYLKLKDATSDYAFKNVILALADADNHCSTLIEIAVPHNMMEEFQSCALDLLKTVLDHIREFASYELRPVLATKLVITPKELTQASIAGGHTEEHPH